MRQKLKEARLNAGMTQQQVADKLRITLRYYKMIEAGRVIGNVYLWDMLEDMFSIHQRVLREIDPDTADSPY